MRELLEQKELEKITVADICHNCGVSVRSFYNHYRDKNELMSSICIHPIREYIDHNRDSLDFHKLLLMTTTLVADNLLFFRHSSLYIGQNNLKDSLVEPLISMYLETLRIIKPNKGTGGLEPSVRFFVLGCLQYATYIMFTDAAEKPEQSAAYFYDCMPWRLKEFLSD